MEENYIEKFVAYAHSQLSLIEDKNGEVVYSSKDTFKRGKYYFLGLNPGGKGRITIKAHLNQFLSKTGNSFFDDPWNSCKEGNAPLQLRVQYLFEKLMKYDLKDVFSTNLIFKTTKTAESLNFGLAGLCWSVHLFALNVIQPEVIITCGNDQEKSAFSFIADLYSGKIEQRELAGTYTIKFSKIIVQNRSTLLIGLPHLSRFEIRDNEDFKQKFLEIMKKNDG